jgi:hypothetical protein
MNKPKILPLFFLLILPVLGFCQKPFAVVELFTSEGCSSCPPADALLSKVKVDAEKKGQNVIILSYHVDYWNKLGWKDPFSKIQYTMRQENYSRVLPGKEMFTPQAIINGHYSFTGSDKKSMNEYLEKSLTVTPKYNLSFKVDSTFTDTAYVSYEFTLHSADYSLKLLLTEDGLSNKITAGENSGKELHHDGVVRYIYSIDTPQMSGTIKIPVNVFSGNGTKHLIGFVQKKKSMEIVAATENKLH